MEEPTIINLDDVVNKKKNKHKRNAPFLPDNPFLALVVGKSGSGKTNVIINAIMQNMIPFDEIIVYSKTLEQPKLAYLAENIRQAEKKTKTKIGTFVDNEAELPAPQDLDPKKKKVVLFDDVLEEAQGGKMSMYYTRGRHVCCNVIFAAQGFFRLKKSAIRENCNYILLFKNISKGDIQQIGRLYAPDISIKQFEKFYYSGTKAPHSFVSMDLEKSVENGSYKHGFTKVVDPRTL